MRIRTRDLLESWGKLLRGKTPLLSIEVTRECPLRCPGCYAYTDGHAGAGANLRDMRDFQGGALVQGILALVDRHDPIHVSLVGGEPLVRHRELSEVLPILSARGVVSLVVTSGVLPIPPAWTQLPRVLVAVSVDGLPRHHDERRHPATYDRILRNIEGCQVYVHWTVVRAQAEQPGYFEEYLAFWDARPEVRGILVSLYSPQRGECSPEMLPAQGRAELAQRLHDLSQTYKKLLAPQYLTDAFVRPPDSAAHCLYASMSRNYSADLATPVEPCVLGGQPDCAQCGCAIGAALHGVQDISVVGPLRVRHLVRCTTGVASMLTRLRGAPDPARITGGRRRT
jgi:sulfatase maturation enzyme AslB (radical SAM superfamily)